MNTANNNEMKRIFILAALGCAILSSCAKVKTAGLNDANKRYFDSWATIYCPDAVKTALGSYVIESVDGNGELITDYKFMRAHCTIRTLDGTVTSTTSAQMDKQLGNYSALNYYGPGIWYRGDSALFAGIEELIQGKHVGFRANAVVPGWLVTSNRYDTAQGYLDNESGVDGIYELEVTEVFNDVVTWEVDSLIRYLKRNYPKVDPADTVSINPDSLYNKKYGFYYIQDTPSPYPDSVFESSASVYINYIGRRLDGTVFDTNVKDTAKFYGIYSSSSTYGPTLINWGESYDVLTMTSSTSDMIDGFKFAIYQMKPYEKGTALFYSGLGYSSSGSGNSIPSYSPLRFDIELVDND